MDVWKLCLYYYWGIFVIVGEFLEEFLFGYYSLSSGGYSINLKFDSSQNLVCAGSIPQHEILLLQVSKILIVCIVNFTVVVYLARKSFADQVCSEVDAQLFLQKTVSADLLLFTSNLNPEVCKCVAFLFRFCNISNNLR